MSRPSTLSNPRRELYKKIYSLLSDSPLLPYNDYTKGFILHHLSDLIGVSVDIVPKVAEVRSRNLLSAELSIQYGNSFFVTTSICFPEGYPISCPQVQVIPTDIEIIIPFRNNVAPCGTVYHPYLRDWDHKISTVKLLVSELANEFARCPPLAIPNLNGALTTTQIKLAKILIENGHDDLYNRMSLLDNEKIVEFFSKITLRYRRHPQLEEFINSTEERVAKFIEIAKDIAKELLPGASSENVDGLSSSRTLEYPNVLGQQEIPTDLEENTRLFDVIAQANLYDEADKKCIFEDLSYLEPRYPLGVSIVNDVIQIHGVIPYSHEGVYYKDVQVIIHLLKPYPSTRPRVFLTCGSGICIRDDLLNVSSNGAVYCSYLRGWGVASTSNLAGLVSHLSAIFSCQPPHATARTSPLEKAAQDSSRNIRQFRPPSQGVHGMGSSDAKE